MADSITVNTRKALHILKDSGKITADEAGIKKGLEILQKITQPVKGYYKITDLMEVKK